MGTKYSDIFRPESTNKALKPCPFCGCTDIVYDRYSHPSGWRWRVWCVDCMAGIDPGYAQDQSTVQRMWNSRA